MKNVVPIFRYVSLLTTSSKKMKKQQRKAKECVEIASIMTDFLESQFSFRIGLVHTYFFFCFFMFLTFLG